MAFTMATSTDAKHILVVEDEQHLAIGIKYNLEAEGYRVSLAGDGPAALQLIENEPAGIDLVVLDLMLPGMSGYAVCEKLRENGNDLPVLMLSANADRGSHSRDGRRRDQYLEKPFDLDELLAMVCNSLLRRSRGPCACAAQARR